MKIQVKTGNLLHVNSGHIVHGCNAQGVMGSGVALAVKNTYPHVYEDYKKEFDTNGLVLGMAYPVIAKDGLMIWNAITQNLYGSSGKRFVSYDAIQICFEGINNAVSVIGNISKEIHIPMIGAARGGGNWNIISTIIEETVDFPVTLWMPDASVDTL